MPSSQFEFILHKGVRLAGGGSEHEGRVEVYYSGSWGTVCDHDWDIKDADVVCRMLEYSSAAAAVHRSYFGEGSGFVLLDNVNCSGSESSLSSCSHNGWGTHNCNHGDGAGVICTYAGIFNIVYTFHKPQCIIIMYS